MIRYRCKECGAVRDTYEELIRHAREVHSGLRGHLPNPIDYVEEYEALQ